MIFDFCLSTVREDMARKQHRRSRATSRATLATNKTNHQETTALPRSRMINVSEIGLILCLCRHLFFFYYFCKWTSSAQAKCKNVETLTGSFLFLNLSIPT